MRTILYIIQKEFLQIVRDKTMFPMIFLVPIVQMVVLVYAATMEMKDIDLFIVDKDLSIMSRQLTDKFNASPFFNISGSSFSVEDGENSIKAGETDIIIHIPKDFEKNLIKNNKTDVQFLVNAINQTVGAIGNLYCRQIILSYNKNIITQYADMNTFKTLGEFKSINVDYQYWYNPELDYKTYMVPGILVLLVTIIGMFLSAMNLVKEKEIGTIEQINVTPVKKYQFIIGKLLPFWLIALFDLALGLSLGKLLFDIPILGSLGVVFLAGGVYLLVVLGFGLLISTITNTQQQAMFISWFFLLIFVLMSGLFTAIESMPAWAQYFNYINPIAYFIKIIRMVLLKGSGLSDIKNEIFILLGYGTVLLSLATLKYRKKTG